MKKPSEFEKEINVLGVSSIANKLRRNDALLEMIGLPFFKWATVYFDNEYWYLDRLISRNQAFAAFKCSCPGVKITLKDWRDKLRMYCHLNDWVLNPVVLRTYQDMIILKDTRASYDPLKNEWVDARAVREMLYIHTCNKDLDPERNYPLGLAMKYIKTRSVENANSEVQLKEIKNNIRTWRLALAIAILFILSIIISLTLFLFKHATNN